jgi:hypothetical protein
VEWVAAEAVVVWGGGGGAGGGWGRGLGGGTAEGPGGECVCPKCKYCEPHQLGSPCYERKCPKCGEAMMRE